MHKLLNFVFKISRWIATPFVRLAYRHGEGIDPLIVFCLYLFPQKILRINGMSKWPVDFRSKVTYPQRITVGKHTFPGLSTGGYIQGRNGIVFGDNVRCGPNVGIISANHDPNDFEKHLPADPIRIGSNVWIGMGSVVMPGVEIGDNVIIGANSVVSKSIPANSIAFGAPCKVYKEKPPYVAQARTKSYDLKDLIE